jgi:hypothetical protein
VKEMVENAFNFWGERVAVDLEGLLFCLSEISDEEFLTYINGKNDFANWIENALHNKGLAEKIRHLTDRELLKETIAFFLYGQDKMIVASPKSFNQDALVQEVLKKNEEFLGKEEQHEHHEKKESLEKEEHHEKKGEHSEEHKEHKEEHKAKGSTISFSLPKRKYKLDAEFYSGLMFGIVVGMLIALIIYRIFFLW